MRCSHSPARRSFPCCLCACWKNDTGCTINDPPTMVSTKRDYDHVPVLSLSLSPSDKRSSSLQPYGNGYIKLHGDTSDSTTAPRGLRSRFLQLSDSDYTQFQDDSSGSPALIIVGVILLLVCTQILHCCIPRQSSLLIEPSLQDILGRRRRRREEIRQRRLREMEAPSSDDNVRPIERLQLTAQEKEEREKEILYLFEANNVQMIVTEGRLIRDGSLEDDDQKNCLMVHLPDRKPLQPDLVPNNCAICLESFAVGEVIVWSNNEECIHAFHQDCALDYLVPLSPEKESPCPCCRQPFCVRVDEPSKPTECNVAAVTNR